MGKGGARIRSGPTRDPNALRRERDGGQGGVELPAEGRQGPVPEWPLTRPTKRELELWEGEWARPQAVMWERNGQELEVAMFVRSVRLAEKPDAPTAARTLVRQQMDSLGISVPGMDRLGWRIAESAAGGGRRRSAGGSARERLAVIDGGGA